MQYLSLCGGMEETGVGGLTHTEDERGKGRIWEGKTNTKGHVKGYIEGYYCGVFLIL